MGLFIRRGCGAAAWRLRMTFFDTKLVQGHLVPQNCLKQSTGADDCQKRAKPAKYVICPAVGRGFVEIAGDLALAVIEDALHARQRDLRHHQIERAEGDRQPQEL